MTRNVPIAPGKTPVLGHAIPLLHSSRVDYLQSLRNLGDAVQIYLGSKPAYVLNSPELIHRMLVADSRNFDKGLLFDRARPYFGNGILTSNGAYHIRQRRMIQPAFHKDTMPRYMAIMNKAAIRHVSAWIPGETIAVESEMRALATSIIARALFDSDCGAHLASLVAQSLPQFVAGVASRTLLPVPPIIFKLPTPANRHFEAFSVQLRLAVQRLIAAYRAGGIDRGDVLSMLLNAEHLPTRERMNDDEITDEVLTLLIAGIETSATTLTWCCYELGRRPDLCKRLQDDINHVLVGRPASPSDIPKLRFTGAFIHEVLRMYPPTWLLMRRTIDAIDLAGVRIPAQSEIIFSPIAVHRDQQLYNNPKSFDPDRWLSGQAPPRRQCSFLPFGAGNHKCIGETFAWNELHIVLATIAARWQLEPVANEKITTRADGVFHIRHLPMIVRPRFANTHRPVLP
jgi:cytochrome P450